MEQKYSNKITYHCRSRTQQQNEMFTVATKTERYLPCIMMFMGCDVTVQALET